MSAIQVIQKTDVGSGLDTSTGQLNVKVDGTSVLLDANGNLSAVTQVDVRLSGAELLGDDTLKLTMSNGDTLEVPLAKFVDLDTNTYLTEAAVSGTTLLLTLSNGSTVTSELSAIYTKVQEMIDTSITASKGTELQSLSGISLGYLTT